MCLDNRPVQIFIGSEQGFSFVANSTVPPKKVGIIGRLVSRSGFCCSRFAEQVAGRGHIFYRVDFFPGRALVLPLEAALWNGSL